MLTNHFWETEGHVIKFLPTVRVSGKEKANKNLKRIPFFRGYLEVGAH